MTAGKAPEDMTDDELDAAQRAADGEVEGTNLELADAANTAASEPNPTTEAAAAPAAGAEEANAEALAKVEGIASKDGSRILPYAALQAERRSRRQAESRYESTARELEDAKQLIADMKAGKTPDTGEVTEADVAQMEEDFPEQGKKMRALFERAKAVQAEPAANASTREDEGDDPVQDAIDQVPLLVEWQAGDAQKFERAIEHDKVLMSSPKWQNKPAIERFTQAARLTAEEYDIAFPEPKASNQTNTPPSNASKAKDAIPRTTLNTLSDFKGGDVADHGNVNFSKMSPVAMLDKFAGMTDDEIDAQLAKGG
jgi:hypothetical protein